MAFGPPPSLFSAADLDPDDPFNWSIVIYRIRGLVTPQIVSGLFQAMKNQYGGPSARVHVEYSAEKSSLYFCCDEVRNVADADALRRFVAGLVQRLGMPAQRVY